MFDRDNEFLKLVLPYEGGQTLFFNHQSLDLTLLDLSKFEPTVSPDKLMHCGKLGPYSTGAI